ncbi:MAG: hypothetical protein IBJ07_20675 [Rhizobiaceae bacterium]|nr:hypothetical protein [Rhizobiaceae bacterium]
MKFEAQYRNHLDWAENLTKEVLSYAPPPGPQNDSFRADLAGLLSTAYVASFECCVKAIFNSFAVTKHKILASYIGHHFEQINSKIHYDTINSNYIRPCGIIYSEKFTELLKEKERKLLMEEQRSLRETYANLIKWRHAFAHEGKKLATLDEVTQAYPVAREIIYITDSAMSL